VRHISRFQVPLSSKMGNVFHLTLCIVLINHFASMQVDKGPSSKEGPYLVQVEEVQNIGLPIRSRYAASHKPNEKRMLRFKFFDGM